jgi:hypothetical protein
MRHKHHWIFFWHHTGCAPCKVRQLRYGFRMDPEGYVTERNKVPYDGRFTVAERLWILENTIPVTVVYD